RTAVGPARRNFGAGPVDRRRKRPEVSRNRPPRGRAAAPRPARDRPRGGPPRAVRGGGLAGGKGGALHEVRAHLATASAAPGLPRRGSPFTLRAMWTAAREFEDIRYETAEEGSIAKITINRPEVRNAFRPQTVAE